MAGIDPASVISSPIDSQSLLGALQNTSTLTRYAYVEKFGTTTPTPQGRALRNAQFKLIQFTAGTEEFYDLLADPYETTNLLSDSLDAHQLANYYDLTMRLGRYQTALTAPAITSFTRTGTQFSVTIPHTTNTHQLWRAATLQQLAWAPVTNTLLQTNGSNLLLTDTNAPAAGAFYRVEAR